MSKWAEIRNDYVEDDILCFDAWLTDDDNEEGVVIAKLNTKNMMLECIDKDVRRDYYALECIDESIEEYYENRFTIWKDHNTKDWCVLDNTTNHNLIRDDSEECCMKFIRKLVKGEVTWIKLMPVGVRECYE